MKTEFFNEFEIYKQFLEKITPPEASASIGPKLHEFLCGGVAFGQLVALKMASGDDLSSLINEIAIISSRLEHARNFGAPRSNTWE